VTALAPDYVEPIEAWRLWAVGPDGHRLRLRSLLFAAVWAPGEPLVAGCQHRRRTLRRPWRAVATDHAAPEERCHCGIYGVRDRTDARRYAALPLPAWAVCRAIGRVALWGEVVEAELGWRASSAYPLELYVAAPLGRSLGSRRARLEEVGVELAAYGVPVHFSDARFRELSVATPASR
jgi:hypothetical protein